MLKNTILVAFIMVGAFVTKAQTPVLNENTSLSEKYESIIYKNFVGECDLMIAYTEESYWWGNRKFYNLLALKKGIWFKGYLSSQLLKSGKWTYPKVKFKEVDPDSASSIVNYLKTAGLFKLSQDSLKITKKRINDSVYTAFSLSDGVNYKFEMLNKDKLTIIEAYEPEYFLQRIPDINAMAAFIKYRDWFTLKYKALEPIDE